MPNLAASPFKSFLHSPCRRRCCRLQVFISSMGREPIVVNGAPVTSPQELATGDKIEVLLENRTRVFYYQGEDETVQIRVAAPAGRAPLGAANVVVAVAAGEHSLGCAARCGAGPAVT